MSRAIVSGCGGMLVAVALAATALGCSPSVPTVTGNRAVGVDSTAEIAHLTRYVQAVHIALLGADDTLADSVDAAVRALRDAGNTVVARTAWVRRLEARAPVDSYWAATEIMRLLGPFALASYENQLARLSRDTLGDTVYADSFRTLAGQHDSIAAFGARLHSGDEDVVGVDRTMCNGYLFYAQNAGVANYVAAAFEYLEGRVADPIEQESGEAMCDSLPATVFLQEGALPSEYIDILLGARLYRESQVRQVFRAAMAVEPTPFVLASYANEYASTRDYRAMRAEILGSEAFFARQGSATPSNMSSTVGHVRVGTGDMSAPREPHAKPLRR